MELIEKGNVPKIDLSFEVKVQDTLLKLADETLLKSAHVCSDGGLAVTIAESCFSSLGRDAIGAEIAMIERELSHEADLFGETPSRIVISFAREYETMIRELVGDCPMTKLGVVTGETLNISINAEPIISASVADLGSMWIDSLKLKLEN